ncbi:Protein of uncharacterised function (DUF3296) [Escherichia coli]|uniref:Protein of uncharacterized function (DUF3296) n=1 Tax=Escherichia coli TaxID=562 RepID=A0A376KWJ4_ECOLX|nr:Protein of uncharacterised function (DUF3296) [Escherichia coli]
MYNANPNYEMNFAILKDVNEHMDGMFQRFSKLLPFRIDFAYRKDTPSFGHSCKHSMCMEIYRLLSETQTMLAGYYWVMEYTPDKGLHIHFIGYLDGQRHKNSYQISRQLGRYLEADHGRGRVIFICAGLKTNTRCVSIM